MGNEALEYLVSTAITKAKSRETLPFDPQGHVLIELSLEPEANESDTPSERNYKFTKQLKKLLSRESTKKILCSIDIRGVKELKESFLDSLGKEYRPKLEALFNSDSRGSVIPLQEEVMMHGFLVLNIIRKAFQKEGKKVPESEIESIKEKLSKHVNKKVNEAFKKALDKAYSGNVDKVSSVDIKKLNKVLDEARKGISLSAEKFLVNQFMTGELKKNRDKINSVAQNITKHLSESSTATDSHFLHIDMSAKLITFIEHSSNTSHNREKEAKTLALRQIMHYRYDHGSKETLNKVWVRVPSIALKGGNTWEAVKDVSDKLAFIKGEYENQSSGSKSLVYNLLTALNGNSLIDRYDERKNKQRESADRILRGAHLANMKEILENPGNPSYCFVQNISINGFGQSLGYSWYKRSTTKEATLMAEIALLHTLKGNNDLIKEAYSEVIEYYKDFMSQIKIHKTPGYFYKSEEGRKAALTIKKLKEQLKSELEKQSEEDLISSSTIDINALAKKALQNLFGRNRHFDHEYAKLVQTLSVLCEEFSITGCKSANERAQAILGRLSMLLRLEGKTRSELSKTENALIDAFNSKDFDAKELNRALDVYYNECGLQGGPSKISLLDQGGPSKLQSVSQSGFLPNTNYGESGNLSYLYQTKASKMQAHKGLAERIRNSILADVPSSKFRKIAYRILSLIGLGFLVSKATTSRENNGLSPSKITKALLKKEETVKHGIKIPLGNPQMSEYSFKLCAKRKVAISGGHWLFRWCATSQKVSSTSDHVFPDKMTVPGPGSNR